MSQVRKSVQRSSLRRPPQFLGPGIASFFAFNRIALGSIDISDADDGRPREIAQWVRPGTMKGVCSNLQ